MAGRLSLGGEDFLRWWAGELKALLPASAFQRRGRHARRLVVAVDGARRSLLLEKSGQTEPLAEADRSEGLSGFAGHVKARADLPLGLRFASGDCFSRTVQLPAQAEGDFRRILDLDMERTTPFRIGEVLTAFHIPANTGTARGKRAVHHLILKRRTLDPLLEELRDLGREPAFADCWDEAGRAGLPIDFLAAMRPQDNHPTRLRLRTVFGFAALLGASALAVFALRHEAALAALQAHAVAARAEAASVRTALEASETAATRIAALSRRLRYRLAVAAIIEELTAILPDSAWISDLRIDGAVVEFNGFAKSAAALIPLLEASPLFAEAALTSPVVLDSNEDKERFSARLHLSMVSAPAESAVQDVAAQEGADQ